MTSVGRLSPSQRGPGPACRLSGSLNPSSPVPSSSLPPSPPCSPAPAPPPSPRRASSSPTASQAALSSQAHPPGSPWVPRKETPCSLALLQDPFPGPVMLLVTGVPAPLPPPCTPPASPWLVPTARGGEGGNRSTRESLTVKGPGPQGRSAWRAGSISANRSPSGMDRTGRDPQGDGGRARLGPQQKGS